MIKYGKVKTTLLVLVVIFGSILLWNYAKPSNPPAQNSKIKISQTVNPPITSQKIPRQYLFVPYWSFTKTIDSADFDSVIYFGVGVNSQGIEMNDKGYENLPKFIPGTPMGAEKILAVRMVDKSINAEVIKSPTLEDKIASQAVSLALKNKFNGILLDYETSAFAFDSTTNNITAFYKLFAKKIHDVNLKFYVTLYGDNYFQSRPFDIKKIGEVSDKVLIMAYDFSKSGGNPGPGFPLSGREKYGYDFSKMVDDFQKDVPNTKIVIIFGYFGYDWKVDSKGNSISSGLPLSTLEITQKLITKCPFKKCSLSRLPNTNEPSIQYADDRGENHIVWFEDEVSISKKKEFLKTKGILETAVWAYSYY